MPKFLIKASYTSEGIKGLKKDKASGRQKAVAAMLEAMGGKLDGIWYALGDHDIYVVCELPSHVHAAAMSATAGATGMLTNFTTTALLTIAEMDQALGEKVTYRAPGH